MRVLIVDDEADIRMILRINLERMGHEVQTAPNAAQAYDLLAEGGVDTLLLDVSMPGETGLQLVRRLRADGLLPPRVALLSAMLPDTWLDSADAEGILQLPKPFGIADLQGLVASLDAIP